jgi:23S rRNA (uridine2552-2'-O)-methyltransferase
MSTTKSTPRKLTRTRRRTKLDKILAGEVPQKQKNIRVARVAGAAPQRKAKDIEVIKPKKKTGKPQYIVRDDYFYEAKRLGYRARSAFKLLEIQEKYNIIKPGMQVLDIASAPGSWLQVLVKMVGPTGAIFGIDIQKIEGFGHQNIHVFQGDVFVTPPIIEFLKKYNVTQLDCITSDIAAHTTGQTGVDQYRSVELNLAILDIADIFLKK